MSKFMLGGSSYGTKSYTLHFDGSHINQSKKAGAGCVIRDEQGEVVVAASYRLTESNPDCNVAITEASALRNGLQLAKTNQIKLSLIKGDSKEVIDHVVGSASRQPKAPLNAIIWAIQAALSEQGIAISKVVLIDREANRVADKLAYFGSRIEGWRSAVIYNFEHELPPQVAEFIRQEKSSGGAGGGGGGGDGGGGGGGSGFAAGSSSSGGDLAAAIGVAGAAIAGIGMVGWGMYKLFSGEDLNNKPNKPTQATRSPFDTVFKQPESGDEFYTLNVDGLDSNQLEKAAAGCIIRDKKGDLVVAAAYNLDSCYPDCHIGIAEAMALKKGLELADEHNIKLDLVEVDNEEVYERVLGLERRPPKVPKLAEIIQDIKIALDSDTELKRIPSEANKVADQLALFGRQILGEKTYRRGDHSLPAAVANQIQLEKNNADASIDW